MIKNLNYYHSCRCCQDFLSSKEDKLIYRWRFCSVIIPREPSIDREKGGHLILFPHRHVLKRLELEPQEAIDLMRASMIIEKAMYEVLPSLGIDLVNINIQDNGNLNIDEPIEKRHLHWHFYGRVRDDKNFSHRQFLNLPPRGSDYYKNQKPFTENDRRALRDKIAEIDKNFPF